MYLSDKDKRVNLRLTDSQFDFLSASAKELNISVSQFIRMVIDYAKILSEKGSASYENGVTDCDDQLQQSHVPR